MLIRISPAVLFICAFAFGSISVFGQSTFQGTNVGPIPDSPGAPGVCQSPGPPRDVVFSVSGISTPPSNISLEVVFDPNHTWGGDVVATLISPNGTQFVIFGYTGNSSAAGTDDGGDDSDLAGPYVFSDSAAGNWWNAAATTAEDVPIPSGSYRTSEIGGLDATGAVTNLNAAFAGIPTSNGTWTLRLTDGCNGDTGGISSASLTLTGGSAVFPRQKANVDMNGLGRSDFVILRGDPAPAASFSSGNSPVVYPRQRQRRDLDRRKSGAPASLADFPIQWWTLYSENGNHIVPTWGDAQIDWPTPADFDGDNKADFAVWRPGEGGDAAFYWIKSTDGTLGLSFFGLTGDNPSVVGDYDGDNKADPAVFRCPEQEGQCYFFYRGSNNNPTNGITYWPFGWGDPFSVRPMPGDFDGDQKYDFCIYTANPDIPSNGVFVLQTSGNLNNVEYISYGLVNLDILVPGDYDGDGRTDFGIVRPENGLLYFYVLERDGGGSPAARIQWGLTEDYIAPGDYDGDGKTDIAIYRWENGGQPSSFWIIKSSDGQAQIQPWGVLGDVPAASWLVQL